MSTGHHAGGEPEPARPPGAEWRAAHGAQVAAALEARDPAEIKRLYADLGDLLEDAYADDVDSVPQLSLPETIPVVTRLLRDASGVVLDAGCGPHPVASIALGRADPARTLIGLDLGLGTVRLARTRAERAGVPLLAVVADLEHLPFRDGVTGGIVCDDTIEHVPDGPAAARELLRVARPGSRVVIATPNRHSLAVLARRARDLLRARRLPASHYFVAESHLREYTWAELDRLVGAVGTIERRAGVGWSGGLLRRAVSRLTALPGLRRLDRMLVVQATPPTR